MENIKKILATIFMVIISTILGSFVLYKIYNWLAVSGLGFPEITYKMSIAIAFLITYLKTDNSTKNNDESFWEKMINAFIYEIVYNTIYLGMAYILYVILFK